MAYNKILLKRRNTAGGTPTIAYGELAWNQADEKLYIGTDAAGGGTKTLAGEGAFVALDPAGSDQTLKQNLTIGEGAASSGESLALLFKEEGTGDKSKIYQASGNLVIAVSDGSPATYTDVLKIQDGTGLVWAKNGFETGNIKLEDDGDGGKLTPTGTNGGVKLSTTGNGKVVLDANSTGAGLDIDAGTAGIDIDSSGTIALDTTGTGKAITLKSTNDVVTITGGKAGAGAVKLNASATDASTTLELTSAGTAASAVDINSAGGVDIDASTTVAIDATAVVIDGTKVGTDAVKLNASGGTTATLHLNSTGTGTAAVDIDSTGGIDVDAAKEINIASSTDKVILSGGHGSASAVTIATPNTNGGIDIDAKQGGVTVDATDGIINLTSTKSSAGAVQFNATGANGGVAIAGKAGGVDIDAAGGHITLDTSGTSKNIALDASAGAILLDAGQAIAEAIKIAATGTGAATQIEINSAGTGDTSTIGDSPIYIASSGGIALDATKDLKLDATTNVTIKSASNAANAVYIHANGGTSETIKVHADQGTGAGAIELTADAGGVDINAGTTVAIDATGAANLTSSGADVTVEATAKSVNIEGGEAAADAVKISASNTTGGIDINAGSGGITVDTSGSLSLDAAGASNLTTSSGAITVDGKAGVTVKANGTNAVTIAADGDTTFAATGGSNADPDFKVSGYARYIDALEVDNIKIDGNAITSINANGNIDITPNGTGEVNITKVDIDGGTINDTTIAGGAVTSLVTSKGDNSVSLSGTVATSSGSKNVTGTSTAFTTELNENDSIEIDGNVYVVDSITSNTALVLTANAAATTTSITAKKDPNLFKVQTGASTDKFVIDKSGNVDVKTGSLTIGGDLVVNGTTTTVNSTTVNVDDNILVLGDLDNAPAAASVNDFGIAWARETAKSGGGGFETKFGGLIWDESSDQVIISDDLGTSTVGATATINTYANFRANHIRIGDDSTNRDVQWQKIYDEIWKSAIGETAGVPNDTTSAMEDKILMIKKNGSAGSYTYDFELVDALDGGTW